MKNQNKIAFSKFCKEGEIGVPLISVVVPVYKTEKYLNQCVDSIINQTFKDYEVILVDDGSPDNCPSICDCYAEKFENIRVVHKANGGLVSARCDGVKEARGKYICFVDSDDFVGSEYLQKFADAIDTTNADIVSSGFTSISEDNKSKKHLDDIPSGVYSKSELVNYIYPRMLSTGKFFNFGIKPALWAKCIRRELVILNQNNLPKKIAMGEDVALFYPCALSASSICIINSTEYMYRYNAQSITHSYNAKMLENGIELIEFLYKVMQQTDWDAKEQLYSYTYMFQSLLIKNELVYRNATFTDKIKTFKKWVEHPLIREALTSENKPKLPKRVWFEVLVTKHNLLFLLFVVA